MGCRFEKNCQIKKTVSQGAPCRLVDRRRDRLIVGCGGHDRRGIFGSVHQLANPVATGNDFARGPGGHVRRGISVRLLGGKARQKRGAEPLRVRACGRRNVPCCGHFGFLIRPRRRGHSRDPSCPRACAACRHPAGKCHRRRPQPLRQAKNEKAHGRERSLKHESCHPCDRQLFSCKTPLSVLSYPYGNGFAFAKNPRSVEMKLRNGLFLFRLT